jgi:hypothetical protein
MRFHAVLFLVAAIAAPAAGAERPLVAQSGGQCVSPPPMKPSSCLAGQWICRCYGGGQVCDWDLVNCETVPGTPRRPGETRPIPDPTRPGTYGR